MFEAIHASKEGEKNCEMLRRGKEGSSVECATLTSGGHAEFISCLSELSNGGSAI